MFDKTTSERHAELVSGHIEVTLDELGFLLATKQSSKEELLIPVRLEDCEIAAEEVFEVLVRNLEFRNSVVRCIESYFRRSVSG